MTFDTLKAIQTWANSRLTVSEQPRLVTANKDGVYYYFQQIKAGYELMMTSLHDVTKEE